MTSAKESARLSLHPTTLKLPVCAIAVFAMLAGVAAAQTSAPQAADAKQTAAPAAKAADAKQSSVPPGKSADAKKSAADAAKEKAKQNAGTVGELQQQLTQQRDQLVADHAALAKQLKDANEAEKKEILERMEGQRKAAEERMSALHKQMIEEKRRERAGRAKR